MSLWPDIQCSRCIIDEHDGELQRFEPYHAVTYVAGYAFCRKHAIEMWSRF